MRIPAFAVAAVFALLSTAAVAAADVIYVVAPPYFLVQFDSLTPGALQRVSRAVMAGGSPTTANSRPPGRNCLNHASGSIGVEPVRTMASYSPLRQPRAPSPASSRAFAMPAPARCVQASA